MTKPVFERVIQPNEERTTLKVLVCEYIDQLPLDKPWIVSITKLVVERTNLQNRALWGCAYKYVEKETGYKPERFHTLICGEYWGWKVDEMFGKKTRVPIRTTTHDEDGKRDVISTAELSEFYSYIQDWVADNSGLQVPDPDVRWKFNEAKAEA